MSAAWCWFLSTLGVILVMGLLVVAVRFFKKLYFLCEESSDLLIDIRNIVKEGSGHGKAGSPKRTGLSAEQQPPAPAGQ